MMPVAWGMVPKIMRQLLCGCAIVVLLSTFVLALQLTLFPYAYDDAYIHLRIARNFVETGFPYYNKGEPVMGSSSPLWTLLLSLVFRFEASASAVALLNTVILILGTIFWGALSALFCPARKWAAGCIGALLALATLHLASIGLMETPLAMLLLGAGLLVLNRYDRYTSLALFLITLAAFARIELSVFVLAALLTRHGRHHWWRALIGVSLAALPLIGYELHFFHTVIPHPIIAKGLVYRVSTAEFVQLLMRSVFGQDLMVQHRVLVAGYLVILIAAGCVAVMVPSRHNDADKNEPRSLTILWLPALAILALYLIKHVLLFPWYLPLFTLPFTLSVALHALRCKQRRIDVFAALIALPLFAQLCCTTVALRYPEWYPDFRGGARVRKYLAIGKDLYRRFPNATLLAPEIGGLGYTFMGKVIDGVGLLSPAALRYHPLKVPKERASGMLGAVPLAFIEASDPDIIVGPELFLPKLRSSALAFSYNVRQESPLLAIDEARARTLPLWKDDQLLIFTHQRLERTYKGPIEYVPAAP